MKAAPRFGAIKSLAFGETVKEKRLTSTVSKLVSLDRRSVSQGIKHRFEVLKGDEPSWLLTKKKPYFVKGAKERDRRSCLCRRHEDARIVFSECFKFRKNLLNQNPTLEIP